MTQHSRLNAFRRHWEINYGKTDQTSGADHYCPNLGPVVANRLVSYTGKQASAGENVLGAALYDAADVLDIVLVEAGGAVAVGDAVGADAQGCAVSGAGTAVVFALSDAATAGDVIRILLRS
ncbi:DUF2190 domain-containing protein [Neisseria leonii]|uniref:DUF2190 domain-containing protein n=1 Tax=Neisseria leonii TaxID=2995413 RepID=UPI00237C3DAA|nr:DUF2190 domain-containing protein [Neisseria sp. 3986]MDD9325345.1 DUF2190 domain-containing protein [Neisseria sp. 3986]